MKHFIGVSLLLAAASLASADIIIQEGNIPQTDFNILFSGAGTDQTGNPVIGRSNGNPAESFLFNFDSATTLAGNGGQARVEGENDTTFTDITLSMNDPDARLYERNIQHQCDHSRERLDCGGLD